MRTRLLIGIGILGVGSVAAACSVQGEEPSSWGIDGEIATASQNLFGQAVNEDETSAVGPVGSVGWVGAGCTATLIDDDAGLRNIVISAAHCFECTTGERTDFHVYRTQNVPDGEPIVLIDEWYPGTVECSPYRNDAVDGFTNPLGSFDVAIVRLDSSVPATSMDQVPRVYTANPYDGESYWAIQRRVVGWGATCEEGNGQQTCPLRNRRRTGLTSQMSIWNDTCGDFLDIHCSTSPLYVIFDQTPLQVGIAKGDSGGPVYGYANSVPFLIGINSGIFDEVVGDSGFFFAPTASSMKQGQWLARQMFESPPLDTITVIGTDAVYVNDRARLSVYNPVNYPRNPILDFTSTEPTSSTLAQRVFLGADSRVPEVQAGTLDMRSRSRAESVVAYEVKQQTDTVIGGGFYRSPRVPTTAELMSRFSTVNFTGTLDMQLNPDQTPLVVGVSAGQYGDVSVKRGRTLALSRASTYYFRSLNIDDGGELRITPGAGPLRIYVENGLSLKGFISFVGDYSPHDVLIGYLGTQSLFIERDDWGATIVAPRAEISLNPGKRFVGALIGQTVTIHQDAVVHPDHFHGIW